MNVLAKIFGLFLLTTPFILGWYLFNFLHPNSFWEVFASFMLVFVICVIEGVFAWYIGLLLLLRE